MRTDCCRCFKLGLRPAVWDEVQRHRHLRARRSYLGVQRATCLLSCLLLVFSDFHLLSFCRLCHIQLAVHLILFVRGGSAVSHDKVLQHRLQAQLVAIGLVWVRMNRC